MKLYTLALGPVNVGILDVPLRQVEVFGQLPGFGAAAVEGIEKMLFGQIMVGAPAVGPVFAALSQLEGTVHLVQGTGGHMAHLMAADSPQQAGGADLGKIQKHGVKAAVPDGGRGVGAAVVGNHIHVIFFTVVIKIR